MVQRDEGHLVAMKMVASLIKTLNYCWNKGHNHKM